MERESSFDGNLALGENFSSTFQKLTNALRTKSEIVKLGRSEEPSIASISRYRALLEMYKFATNGKNKIQPSIQVDLINTLKNFTLYENVVATKDQIRDLKINELDGLVERNL